MNPILDSVKTASRYSKSRDTVFGLLLAGGTWLASEVNRQADRIDAKLDNLTARVASLETALALRTAKLDLP
jgi:hypothetical protein